MPTAWRRATPQANTAHPITAEAVGDIEASIVPIVGSSRRLDCDGKWITNRDAHDIKMVNEFVTNTGPSEHFKNESFYGGFPPIAGGTPCPDTDNDGMPNAWEVTNGFNPSVGNNNAAGTGGYTQLENFLAGESGPAVVPAPQGENKFAVADRVSVTSTTANVRATPGGTLLGTQALNSQGAVTAGPTPTANGVIWYNINFDTGVDGWVGQDVMERVIDSGMPPTVAITSPVNGQTVSGAAFEIIGGASDNVGVAGYQLKLDGANLGAEDTSGSTSYSFLWNTTVVSNDPHTLTAVARDAAGNQTTSAPISVTVNNAGGDTTPPTVALTAPAAGNVSGNSVSITATASDAVGVVGVSFHAIRIGPVGSAPGPSDTNLVGVEDTTSTYGVVWDTTVVPNGPYNLFAVARDAAGNKKTSAAVAVTVANGLATPGGLAATREAP